jgi:TolB-like protein
LLLEHPGEVVTREELRARLWPADVFVDFDSNLNTAVTRLREALGDSAEKPRYVETLPRRGYRFVAPLSTPARGVEGMARRKVRLVALPFDNLSGDPAQEYFSDGMTEELITELACLAPEQLAVIARTSAMHYKGSNEDVARIGRERDVDYVVEGSVRRADHRVRISAQLIQAGDQAHLWAKSYDSELPDALTLQSDVARAIVHWFHHWNLAACESELECAIDLNPNDPTAHWTLAMFLGSTKEDHQRAATEASLALSLDPRSIAIRSMTWWIHYWARRQTRPGAGGARPVGRASRALHLRRVCVRWVRRKWPGNGSDREGVRRARRLRPGAAGLSRLGPSPHGAALPAASAPAGSAGAGWRVNLCESS